MGLTERPPETLALEPVEADEEAERLERLEEIIEQGRAAFMAVGTALTEIQEDKLYKRSRGGIYANFAEYLDKRWRGMGRQTGYNYIHARRVVELVQTSVQNGALPDFHQAVELKRLPDPDIPVLAGRLDFAATSVREVKEAVNLYRETELVPRPKGGQSRSRGRLASVAVAPPPPVLMNAPRDPELDQRLITLDVWHGLTPDQQAQVLNRPYRRDAHFNEQKSTDIEWAQWSWNPVTGCKHDCSYCYARDIAEGGAANRNPFPQRFVPTFLPERLGAPALARVPDRAATDTGFRNVFTCSMADLFGRWVPREWIEAVLAVVRAHPQWNFLFLTKFPIRLQEFNPFPDNAWVGTTVDAQARVRNAERAFARVDAKVKWLSCEPLLEPLTFKQLKVFQWVVMGGASASTQTPVWRPPRPWVDDLRAQARRAGCQVYEKTNLLERLREYPGQPPAERISVPDAFKMGYLQRDVLEPQAYRAEMAG